MRGKNFSDEEVGTIRLLRQQKMSIGDIAALLKRSKSGVHGQVKKLIDGGKLQAHDLGSGDGQQ